MKSPGQALAADQPGRRMAMVRRMHGLTQKEMAATLGLSASQYSKAEGGFGNLGHAARKMFCTLYRVTEEWLIHGRGRAPTAPVPPVAHHTLEHMPGQRPEPTVHEAAGAIARQMGVSEDALWRCMLECLSKLRAGSKAEAGKSGDVV